ncbi:urease accessory protein UreD [Dactylosporangium sp. NPDC048998]|uniref:urease accessory protein UreD n=1 Tax=Dactylosporangium sp. NPDC048998 TaxID=3363976 RepID=UPI0037177FBF
MRAAARIVVERAGDRTVLRVLKGEAPLLPRRTGPNGIHIVGGAAGPLGGDDLSLEIEVGPGAELWVRTVAASVALPGRDGAESRLSVHAVVGEGALLAFLPEPIVAAARCRHHNLSTVDLAAGGRLVWREEAVFGRHGEAPGDLRLSTAIRRGNRAWYRGDVAVGPSHPDGPAILNGARVLATLITTDIPEMSEKSDNGSAAAIMALAGGGTVVTAIGDDLTETRRLTGRLVTPAQ